MRKMTLLPLAAVLVLAAVLAVILIAILVIVLVLILVVILISVLIVHSSLPPKVSYGIAATLVYPLFQDLSFALKRRLAITPEMMAAVIPPAEAFSPPRKIPRKPSC